MLPGLRSTSTIEQEQTALRTTLRVSGVVDGDLAREPFRVGTPELTVDWSGVRRITSRGVAAVIDAGRLPGPEVAITWTGVSVALVLQLGMVANFAGRARIASFFAPYWCAACHADRVVALETERIAGPRAPAAACPACGGALHFEELESDFFSWLEPQRPQGP